VPRLVDGGRHRPTLSLGGARGRRPREGTASLTRTAHPGAVCMGSSFIRGVAGVGEVEALVGQGKSGTIVLASDTGTAGQLRKDESTTSPGRAGRPNPARFGARSPRATPRRCRPRSSTRHPRRRPRGWTHRRAEAQAGEEPARNGLVGAAQGIGARHRRCGRARASKVGRGVPVADATRGRQKASPTQLPRPGPQRGPPAVRCRSRVR